MKAKGPSPSAPQGRKGQKEAHQASCSATGCPSGPAQAINMWAHPTGGCQRTHLELVLLQRQVHVLSRAEQSRPDRGQGHSVRGEAFLRRRGVGECVWARVCGVEGVGAGGWDGWTGRTSPVHSLSACGGPHPLHLTHHVWHDREGHGVCQRRLQRGATSSAEPADPRGPSHALHSASGGAQAAHCGVCTMCRVGQAGSMPHEGQAMACNNGNMGSNRKKQQQQQQQAEGGQQGVMCAALSSFLPAVHA